MNSYGLIGRSLVYSFSKAYFEEKFRRSEIDARYDNLEFDTVEEVRPRLDHQENLKGLNVTIPYKQSIIPYLDDLDSSAEQIGAVNTIALRGGKWIGFNTDYYGFMTSLKPFLENKHNRALILGSGGASLAIQYALKQMEIPFHIVSQKRGKSELC